MPQPRRHGILLASVALDHDLVVAGDHGDGVGAVGAPLPEQRQGLLQAVGARALDRGVQPLGVGASVRSGRRPAGLWVAVAWAGRGPRSRRQGSAA
jgi:hypothetical protein